MKFIHTADLHLDSPFDNLRSDGTPTSIWQTVYHSTYESFARIIQDAIKYDVDFVLIVGDLFDRQDRDVRAQHFLKHQLEILNQHHIIALISFGNHDYYSGDYQALDYPNNTYVFPSKVTTKQLNVDGKVINVTGFSYSQRWETERMIDQFPDKQNCDYQIGMIHGQVSSGRSNYTPFSLGELLSKHYDYWALGHVHKRQALNAQPPVIYPGNIQGRNPNETGDKDYVLVDSDDQLKPEFHSTSVINWTEVPVLVKVANDETDLIDLILRTLSKRNFAKLQLVDVQLIIHSPEAMPSDLQTVIYNQNLLDQVQAKLKDNYQQFNAWVYHISLKIPGHYKLSSIDSDLWSRSAEKVFYVDNVDKLAKKLFQYPFLNQRFNSLRSIKNLKQRILQLIINHRSSQDEN